MEYLPYFISAGLGVIVWFLQTSNNRRYNEFQNLKKLVDGHETQIAVNTNSDEKDSKRFDEHQKSMDTKFSELNKMLNNFTSKVESEIKEIKNTVGELKVSIAGLNSRK